MFVTAQGCKWRGLPKRFGNWHTIYNWYRLIFSRFDKLDMIRQLADGARR